MLAQACLDLKNAQSHEECAQAKARILAAQHRVDLTAQSDLTDLDKVTTQSNYLSTIQGNYLFDLADKDRNGHLSVSELRNFALNCGQGALKDAFADERYSLCNYYRTV